MNHRPDELLNDSTLERELEAIVDVDPSPEFLARVRTRIAQEPAPSSWRWHWRFALAGGVAATVTLIAMLIAPWMVSSPAEGPHMATLAEDVALESAPSTIPPNADTTGDLENARLQNVRSVRLQPDRDVRGGRLQAARQVQADAPPFAEVLVSADEVRAYEFVVGITRQRRLPAPPIEEPVDGVLPPVKIEPLTIEPLPQIARLETGERP